MSEEKKLYDKDNVKKGVTEGLMDFGDYLTKGSKSFLKEVYEGVKYNPKGEDWYPDTYDEIDIGEDEEELYIDLESMVDYWKDVETEYKDLKDHKDTLVEDLEYLDSNEE